MRGTWVVVAVALIACKESKKQPAPKPAEPTPIAAKEPTPSPPPAPTGACENVELERASKILGDAAHPCRARIEAAYGRMLATGTAFSGTVVSTKPARGAGLVVTCQHCTGPDGNGIKEPETDEPSVFHARAPAKLGAGKITSGRQEEIYFVHRLFSLEPPKSAFNKKGHLVNILPKHDFVVGTVNGKPVETVGHLGVMPNAKIDDKKLDLHDPSEVARSQTPWADPKPGTQALILGFPRDIEGKPFEGELVASVGEILDDTRAKAMLLRSDPDEAAIPYDPEVELVVAARASSGMSGGGTFDEAGRYLGVNVRGTIKPVDGKYLTRVVRASYIMKQLDAALAAAPDAARTNVTAFIK